MRDVLSNFQHVADINLIFPSNGIVVHCATRRNRPPPQGRVRNAEIKLLAFSSHSLSLSMKDSASLARRRLRVSRLCLVPAA